MINIHIVEEKIYNDELAHRIVVFKAFLQCVYDFDYWHPEPYIISYIT